MVSRAAVGVGIALLAFTSQASAESVRCKVRYATSQRAYFTIGASEGVAVGDELALMRHGKAFARCKIDVLAQSSASCRMTEATTGDECRAARGATSGARPKAKPPMQSDVAPSPTEAAAVEGALRDTPNEKIVYKAASVSAARGQTLFSASVGHSAYVTFDGRHYEQERIDLALHGVSLRFGGFRAWASLTAIIASVRPTEQRFRPNDIAQVYVWQTEFSSREVGRPFAFAIGRIWPHHTPGLPMLDGMQVGWRKKDGSAEVGVFGGTVPDPTTIYPTYRRWLAGFYFGHTAQGPAGSPLRLVLHEGRIDVRQTDKNGLQLETEMALQFNFGRKLQLATSARATIGADSWTAPQFEAGRVSLSSQPIDRLRITAAFRYLGKRAINYDGLGEGFTLGRQYVGSVDVQGDLTRWLTLTVGGLVQHEEESGNGRQSLLGELNFHGLPRRGGAVALGYQEAFGWMRGHAAYVQYSNSSLERLRLLARVTYAEDLTMTAGAWHREVSAWVQSDVRIVRWLSLRMSALARVVVASPTDAGESEDGPRNTTGGGVVVRADLVGSL